MGVLILPDADEHGECVSTQSIIISVSDFGVGRVVMVKTQAYFWSSLGECFIGEEMPQ